MAKFPGPPKWQQKFLSLCRWDWG